jgi:hypothetical protein
MMLSGTSGHNRMLRVERPRVVEDRGMGGRQRRPVGERRLHLRQAAPTRDRPAHPLPDKAPECTEVVDPGQQKRRNQVFFGATVTYAFASSELGGERSFAATHQGDEITPEAVVSVSAIERGGSTPAGHSKSSWPK